MPDSMAAATEAAPPMRTIPSVCPVCGLAPVKPGRPFCDEGVWRVFLVCDGRHIWGVHWADLDEVRG